VPTSSWSRWPTPRPVPPRTRSAGAWVRAHGSSSAGPDAACATSSPTRAHRGSGADARQTTLPGQIKPCS